VKKLIGNRDLTGMVLMGLVMGAFMAAIGIKESMAYKELFPFVLIAQAFLVLAFVGRDAAGIVVHLVITSLAAWAGLPALSSSFHWVALGVYMTLFLIVEASYFFIGPLPLHYRWFRQSLFRKV